MTNPVTNEARAKAIVERWAWQESEGPLNEDFKQLSAIIAAALEEAEERGKRSEAAVWELAKVNQEMGIE
jgi:hypothetical protein